MNTNTPKYDIIPEISMAWESRLRKLLDTQFRGFIRVLHGPPSRDRIAGKQPVVSVHLIEIEQAHNDTESWNLRLNYLLSAWVENPLDEQRLLERIRLDVDMNRTLVVRSIGHPKQTFQITPCHGLKVESAISFWNVMGWPVRASLQYTVSANKSAP